MTSVWTTSPVVVGESHSIKMEPNFDTDDLEVKIPKRATSPMIDAVAGGISGMVGIMAGSPFDVVKARMQNSHVKIGALQVISKTLQKEGATAFWKGVTPPLLAEGVLNHIWFGTYAIMAAYFHPDPTTPLNFSQAFVSGGVAGALGAIIVAPSDLIKLQSQVNEGTGKDRMKPLDVVREIYSKEGLVGFTRGFCPALLRDVPGLGMFFGVYNAMKNLLRQPDGTVSGFGQIVAGGTSGIGSWIVSYPYDVIKTRMQVSKEYTSVRHCAMQAYRTEGAMVFYRGMLPCLIGSFPINAIIFFIYEFLIQASWSLHAEAKEK